MRSTTDARVRGLPGRAAAVAAAVAAALAVGVVTGAAHYLSGMVRGMPVAFAVATLARFLAALAWVPTGIAVFWVWRRWPVRYDTWRRTVPIHLALAAGVSGPVNVLILLSWKAAGIPVEATPFWAAATSAALSNLPANALMYVCVCGWAHLAPVASRGVPSGNGRAVPTAPAGAAALTRDVFARRVSVATGTGVIVIDVQDIDWIEAADDYACLHVGGGEHLHRERLRELEAALDPREFVRVHRSALVNLSRVASVTRGPSGNACLTLRDGTAIKVSRSRKTQVLGALASQAGRIAKGQRAARRAVFAP